VDPAVDPAVAPASPMEIVKAPVALTVAEPKTRDRDPVADLSELDPVPGVEPARPRASY
jgi:hypothetical protein